MTPATALMIASIGGTLTRDQARAAWIAYPECRDMLDAYAAAHLDGWAA